VHAGVGAVDDVDIAAVIHFDVVRLDRYLRALVCTLADATLVGLVGDGRDVIRDLRSYRWPQIFL